MLGWAKDPQGGLAECHLLETTQGVEFDISAIGGKARVDNFVFIKNYYFIFVGVHMGGGSTLKKWSLKFLE